MSEARCSLVVATILICIQLCSGQAIADEGRWSSGGPHEARVRTIAIHPDDNQRIYIGTIENGIYQTTDGGANWFLMEDDSLDITIRDIVFHPAAPETMYAGTQRGMYRSFDEGNSWSLMRPPGYWYNNIKDLEIHPVDHDIIFAGGSSTNVKSTDGGNSWYDLDLPWVAVVAIRTDPLRPDTIYLATQSAPQGLSVFRSEDLGESWYQIHNDLDSTMWAWDLAIDPVNSNTLYLGGSSHPQGTGVCLEKTTDAGEHWFDITPPGLVSPWIITITISPFDHSTVYICTEATGVLKSTDGGETWREINEGLDARTAAKVEIDSVTAYLYLGTYYHGIYRSTNGGESWQKISNNINQANCEDLSINRHDSDSLYVASIGGVYRSVDGASSWQNVELDFPFYETRANGVQIDPYDPNYVYVSFYDYRGLGEGGIFRSTDGGETWDMFTNGLPEGGYYGKFAVADYGDGSRRLFLGAVGLYYSDDLGENWALCQGGLPSDLYYGRIEVSNVDPDLIFVSDWGDPRLVYRSTDGGQTWAALSSPPGNGAINSIACDPFNSDIVYACRSHEGVFRSTDTGQSWVDISNNLPRDPDYFIPSGVAINPLNPQILYVNSARYGIFVSHDGGRSWEDFNEGLRTGYSHAVTAIAPSDTNRIFLATSSQSVWTITKIPTSVDNDDVSPREYSILSNYPNPFNSITVIQYSLLESEPVILSIYNILGQQVATIFEGLQQAGEHTPTWDASAFPSGVYFARMKTLKSSQSLKMILLK